MTTRLFNGSSAFEEFLKVLEACLESPGAIKMYVSSKKTGLVSTMKAMDFAQIQAIVTSLKEVGSFTTVSRHLLTSYNCVILESGTKADGEVLTATLLPRDWTLFVTTSDAVEQVHRPKKTYTRQDLVGAINTFFDGDTSISKMTLEQKVSKSAMQMCRPMTFPESHHILSVAYHDLCTKGALQFELEGRIEYPKPENVF